MKNLNAIVWLYRGEVEKYQELILAYQTQIINDCIDLDSEFDKISRMLNGYGDSLADLRHQVADTIKQADDVTDTSSRG